MTGQTKHTGAIRAAGKLAIVLASLIVLIAVLCHFISERDLETLKHSLPLWALVMLVIIINLVSAACFMVAFAAWQWIRCDLKPKRDDGLDG